MRFRLCFTVTSAVALLCACGQIQHGAGSPVVPQSFQRMEPAPAPNGDLLRDGNARTPVFKLGDGGPNAHVVYDARVGADEQLYYSTNPNIAASPVPVSGEIGSFNFTSHAQHYQSVSYNPGFIEETADGSVWVGEFNNSSGNPAFDRYSVIGGKDTQIPVQVGPFSGFNGLNGGIAVGADGRLWFGVGNYGNGGNDVGEIDQHTDAVSLYSLPAPSGGVAPSTAWIVLGPDKHLWATDTANDAVFRITSAGPQRGASSYTQLPQGPLQPPNLPFAQGIGTLRRVVYAGVLEAGVTTGMGALDQSFATAPPSFSALSLPAIGVEPLVFLAGTGGKLYFIEYKYGGLGIYDPVSGTMTILPTATPAGGAGAGLDRNGNPWISCVTAGGAACIEEVALTSTWAIYPGLSLTLYTTDSFGNQLPPGLLGIGETGNSGPFSVKSSNASVCTAKIIRGFDHNVQVNPVTEGKCVLMITDAHAHSVNVNVTVVKGSGNPRSSPYHAFRLH